MRILVDVLVIGPVNAHGKHNKRGNRNVERVFPLAVNLVHAFEVHKGPEARLEGGERREANLVFGHAFEARFVAELLDLFRVLVVGKAVAVRERHAVGKCEALAKVIVRSKGDTGHLRKVARVHKARDGRPRRISVGVALGKLRLEAKSHIRFKRLEVVFHHGRFDKNLVARLARSGALAVGLSPFEVRHVSPVEVRKMPYYVGIVFENPDVRVDAVRAVVPVAVMLAGVLEGGENVRVPVFGESIREHAVFGEGCRGKEGKGKCKKGYLFHKQKVSLLGKNRKAQIFETVTKCKLAGRKAHAIGQRFASFGVFVAEFFETGGVFLQKPGVPLHVVGFEKKLAGEGLEIRRFGGDEGNFCRKFHAKVLEAFYFKKIRKGPHNLRRRIGLAVTAVACNVRRPEVHEAEKFPVDVRFVFPDVEDRCLQAPCLQSELEGAPGHNLPAGRVEKPGARAHFGKKRFVRHVKCRVFPEPFERHVERHHVRAG